MSICRAGSFLSWIFERRIRQFEFASAQQSYGVYQAVRRIAHFFMKGFFLIEVIMTRGVRSIVSNVTCNYPSVTGGDETHVREPALTAEITRSQRSSPISATSFVLRSQ